MLALFAGDHYYPNGGWDDFRGVGTVEELKLRYEVEKHQWGQIVDLEARRVLVETHENLNHWRTP